MGDSSGFSNSFVFTGPAGELKWGYYPAATLASWTISGGESLTLTAKIVSQDTFRVSQQPLTFQPIGRSWRWAVQSLQIVGDSVTAALAPQE